MLEGTQVNGEVVLELNGRTYVQSRSKPGRLWEATYETCECPLATKGRKYCRHQKAVSEFNRKRAEERRVALRGAA